MHIVKTATVKDIVKKDPFFMLCAMLEHVHRTGDPDCHFTQTLLVKHLHKFRDTHQTRFTFNPKAWDDSRESHNKTTAHIVLSR